MMLSWSHFQFRQFLLHKVREYPWCRVIICTEEYTSKTCGRCGHVHLKLGGSKVFRCPNCMLSLIGISTVLAIYYFATLLLQLKSRFIPALGPTSWDLRDPCRTCIFLH